MTNRIDWENAVFDAMTQDGEMTRSDAQALVEAQTINGHDALEEAWSRGLTASEAAQQILEG